MLTLSNKFIEIGQEFGGSELFEIGEKKEKTSLLHFLAFELTKKYTEDFNNLQITNVKNLLEREEWDRLPLPDNFRIKEIYEPLGEYPKPSLMDN